MLDQLKNTAYRLPLQRGEQIEFTLAEGTATLPGLVGRVSLLETPVAYNDLNGDGLEDAVVTLVHQGGGSGSFVSAAPVLNRAGTPEASSAEFLGDRVGVNGIGAEGRQVTVDLVTHGPNDPFCCPSMRETRSFIVPEQQAVTATAASYKDISYEIEGRVITLANGLSEIEAAAGSASKIVTRYFGNDVVGDLNGDGTPDIAFLLTQSGGGSGTFYDIVIALQTPDGYMGTNAVLLGYRIAPQTTELRDGSLVVNYADRHPGEAMTTRPSVGVSKYLKVEHGKPITVRR